MSRPESEDIAKRQSHLAGVLVQASVDALASLRRVARPFLLVQISAGLLVIGYYTVPIVHFFGGQVSTFKAETGYLFSGIGSALAGMVLPLVSERITLPKERREQMTPIDLAYRFLLFAIIGLTVDAFYRLQGLLFGHEIDVSTVTKKVLLDMFVFSPLIALPLTTIALMYQASRFSFAKLRRGLVAGGFGPRLLTVMISAWAYWIPVLAGLYALPQNLQYPLSMLAEGAWALVVVAASATPSPPSAVN